MTPIDKVYELRAQKQEVEYTMQELEAERADLDAQIEELRKKEQQLFEELDTAMKLVWWRNFMGIPQNVEIT